MASKTRNTALSLKEQLIQHPYLFEFSQAIRLIQALQADKTSLGQGCNPEKEAVRLKARVNFSMPPSDLFDVHPSAPDAALEPLEMQVNFLGLAGIQGPLPTPYTEKLLDQLKGKNRVFKDFLDIFNHRLLSLYFRIQQKFSPALSMDLPHQTPQGKSLQAIAGTSQTLESFNTRPLLMHAATFWQKPHNPEGLRLFLQHMFQVPVQITPFQGAWIDLDPHAQTILGYARQTSQLGKGAVLGKRVWCQHQGVLVRFILEDIHLLQKFLPTGVYFSKLRRMIASYGGPGFSFKIGLRLTRRSPSWLDKNRPMLLGWSSWLGRGIQISKACIPRDGEVIFSATTTK